MINDIIEFDRKLSLLPPLHPLFIPSKRFWDLIIATYFIYNGAIQFYICKYLRSKILLVDITECLFRPPCIIDCVIVVSSYFYLSNIGCRFCVLNKYWKCLPRGLVASPGKWTNFEIAVLVENIRLLNANSCDLLKGFSSSYGPTVLAYFLLSYFRIALHLYIMLIFSNYDRSQKVLGSKTTSQKLIPLLLFIQHTVMIFLVLYLASWVDEKVSIILCSVK